MENEIELKFFVSPEFSDVLKQKLTEQKILQQNTRDLGNTYFDTQDNCFANTTQECASVASMMCLCKR